MIPRIDIITPEIAETDCLILEAALRAWREDMLTRRVVMYDNELFQSVLLAWDEFAESDEAADRAESIAPLDRDWFGNLIGTPESVAASNSFDAQKDAA